MDKRFIFDLDDTLIYTDYSYIRAEANFLEFMIKEFSNDKSDFIAFVRLKEEIIKQGYTPKQIPDIVASFDEHGFKFILDICETQIQYDFDLVNESQKFGNGFSIQRFPLSFVYTYEKFAMLHGKEISQEKKDEAYSIGNRVFKLEQSNIPGSIELLEFLKENNDNLVLLTRGERKQQNDKIDANSLRSYFSKINVVDKKTPELISSIAKGCRCTYIVGDSVKSDIIPALQAGIGAIYIPSNSWKFEQANLGLEESKKVIKIKNIKEMMQLYPQL